MTVLPMTEKPKGMDVVDPASWEPRLVALVCNWCTYAGADLAGTARLKYPANVRMVRFPCTGRMNPLMILKSFEHGADGVIVSGCHPGDCHYVQGNLVARRRFAVLRALLDFLGVDMRRVHFAWVSAAEGKKWATLVEEVTQTVQAAGPMQPFGRADESSGVELPALSDGATRPSTTPQQVAAVRDNLRAAAKSLLCDNNVKEVIGVAAGRLRTVPAFVTTAGECESLEWNAACHTNLARYLSPKRDGKVAVVVKKCDVGAVVGLIRENQIERSDVVMVGGACAGVFENGELAIKCKTCDGQPHEMSDVVVDAEGYRARTAATETAARAIDDARTAQVAHLESLPAEKRWQYWQEQLSRCLRCYACRASCPLCYCASCITDKHRPQWVTPAIDNRGNSIWNVVRAYHLAGRCTGCDECARACPADIRIDLINHKLRLEIEKQFGESGDDPQAKAALLDFRMEDPQGFVR